MKNKILSVCSAVLLVQCFVTADGENEQKLSWSVFGGDKNKIVGLQAVPSFDTVLLTWLKYHDTSPLPENQDSSERTSDELFDVKLCENQAWGLHQCNSKAIPSAFTMNELKQKTGLTITKELLSTEDPFYYFSYSLTIKDLRMSTIYSISIGNEGQSNAKNVTFQTKGFSAQSIVCEPSRTRIEIETGPNFGGQISVDGTIPNSFPSSESNNGKEFCFLNGNSSSTQTRFIFEIDHKKCDGVKISGSEMSASLTVQESLVIMTHSTRRFSINCDFGPTTFTVAAGLNVPLSNMPQVATGVGSITEEFLDIDESRSLKDISESSLKDISTARRKRKLRFHNESEEVTNENDPVYSTVIVRKRKKGNQNSSMETSAEDERLIVTANGLVPMPKIDLEFGSPRKDKSIINKNTKKTETIPNKNSLRQKAENMFASRVGFASDEIKERSANENFPWKFPSTGSKAEAKPEIRFPENNHVLNWAGKIPENLAVEWDDELTSDSNSVRKHRQVSKMDDSTNPRANSSRIVFRDKDFDYDLMYPLNYDKTNGDEIRKSKNLKLEDLPVNIRGGKRAAYPIGTKAISEEPITNEDLEQATTEGQTNDDIKKASALASSTAGSKGAEAPAVPYLVLMVVLVISAIIATGATTYWLITTCQRKINVRNREFPEGKSCILSPMPTLVT